MILNINLQEIEKEPLQNESIEVKDQNQNQNFSTNYRIEIPNNLKNEIFLLLDETSTFEPHKLLKTMELEQQRQQNLYDYFKTKKEFEDFYQPNAQSIIDKLQQRQNTSKFDTLSMQIANPLEDKQKLIMQKLMSIKKIYCHLGIDEDTYYTSRIYDIYFTENQKYFVASSTNGQIKIFETENMLLQRTLKGKNKEITMIVSDQQSQILCFTDGETIFVYDFQNYQKLSELNVPSVTEFSCMDLHTSNGQTILFLSDQKYGLFVFRLNDENLFEQIDISANICSYVKQFEFYKKKQLLYTYRQDYLDIWNVKELIDKKSNHFHPKKQIFINQKGSNFHLSPEMNSLYIISDKNFHSICKIIDGEDSIELLRQKYKKINFVKKERNQAICTNKRFSVIAVNTFVKGEDESEFEQQNYELYTYANVNSEEIHLLDHITQENNPTILQLNDSVCVISSNPVYENIFLLGLSEGNLIILDIENLQVLQIIKENCDHLKQPSLQNPVLEAQFLQNGIDIITGTFFGSISLYSIDIQQQQILTCPDQQFFLNDYTPTEDDIQGNFCDANMKVHKKFTSINIDDIYEHYYDMQVDNIIYNLIKNDEKHKQEFQSSMNQQMRNLQERYQISDKPMIHPLYDYKTQHEIEEIKKEKKNSYIKIDYDDSQSINSSEDSQSFEKIRRPRRSFLQDSQQGYKLKSKRLRKNNFKIEDSAEEEILIDQSVEEIQEKSIKRERKRSQRQEQQIISKEEISLEPDIYCSFCEKICNNEIEQCYDCQQIYCLTCSDKILYMHNRVILKCLHCYYVQKRKYDKIMKWEHQKEPSRFYVNIEMQNFVEQLSQILIYQPQIKESYYFIPKAFNKFFKEYFNHFEPDWALDNMKKLLLLEKDFCIEIIDYQYEFPQIPTKVDQRLSKDILITQKIKAKIIEGSSEQNSNLNSNLIEFYFSFTDQTDMLFLIPRSIYEYCSNNTKNLQNNSVIDYKGDSVFLNRINISETLYESIEFIEMQEGKNLRNRQKSERILGHPWYITTFIDQAPIEDKLIKNQILLREIQGFCQRNIAQYTIFMNEVDKECYKDYLQYVKVEMNLNFIIERLSNEYYYSKESLFKDFELIEINCKRFNEPESDISKLSEQLVIDLKKLVVNTMNSRGYRRPIFIEKNNQIQDSQLLTKKISKF